jgi:hypothetical protein
MVKNKGELKLLVQPIPIVLIAIGEKMDIRVGFHGKDRKIRRTVKRCKLARIMEDGKENGKDSELKELIKEEVEKQPSLEFKSGYIKLK